MTRIIIIALTTAFAAAVLATFGLRNGAIVITACAGVAGFAFAIVFVRRWATRGCSATQHRNDSSDLSNSDGRENRTRHAA